MNPALVQGPAWTGKGIDESPGRYPLAVEGAVFRLVDKLLPGIITTTRHPRMYSVHALAWAEAHELGLDAAEAAAYVRRWEAVIARSTIFTSRTGHGCEALMARKGSSASSMRRGSTSQPPRNPTASARRASPGSTSALP